MQIANSSVGVTGATGFVGSHLIKKLKLDGRHAIKAFSRKSSEDISGVLHEKIEDICSHPHWKSMLAGLDCVIHTAARVHIMNEPSQNALEEFRRVNVKATLDIAEAAASAGVKRFIFISSIKVNGEETQPNAPFSPDAMPAPTDPYGVSKAEAEIALKTLAARTGMEVVIIRPVLVYGIGVKANFLNLMKLVQSGIPLPFGAIHNKRSLVAIDNLVDLIVTCIDHPNAANRTFLVSDGHDLSTTELLRRMAKALSKKIILLPLPPTSLKLLTGLVGKGAIGQRLCGSLQVDIRETETLLGWTPPFTIDHVLEKMVKNMQRDF